MDVECLEILENILQFICSFIKSPDDFKREFSCAIVIRIMNEYTNRNKARSPYLSKHMFKIIMH